jgi:hypothetical protein
VQCFFLFGELLLSLGDPKKEERKSVNPAKDFFFLKKKSLKSAHFDEKKTENDHIYTTSSSLSSSHAGNSKLF